jgi:hypothetical protein
MIRKSVIFLLGVCLILGGTAYSQQKQPSLAEIVKAAEKEGEVRWTSTFKDDEVEPFIKAFNKDTPKSKSFMKGSMAPRQWRDSYGN